MQQSNVIFGYLLASYLLFITMRGELGTYITLLRGGGAQPASGGAGTSTNPILAGAESMLSGSGPVTSGAENLLSGNPASTANYLDSGWTNLFPTGSTGNVNVGEAIPVPLTGGNNTSYSGSGSSVNVGQAMDYLYGGGQ